MVRTPLCISGTGVNKSHKVGVHRVQAGQWTVTVKTGTSVVTVQQNEHHDNPAPGNPQYVNLAPLRFPA